MDLIKFLLCFAGSYWDSSLSNSNRNGDLSMSCHLEISDVTDENAGLEAGVQGSEELRGISQVRLRGIPADSGAKKERRWSRVSRTPL